MRLVIVGAGMAGLLASRMLLHKDPLIIEALPSLPHNHSAVLRFRTSTVGDVTGIPFRKVSVVRTTAPWRNPAADALAYSKKVTGLYLSDRSISREQTTVDRWIAPHDFVERLSRGTEISYGKPWDFSDRKIKVISTIPMQRLMQELDYPDPRPRFEYKNGVNVSATVHGADAYASVYVPNPDLPFYRVSITGDQLIAEMSGVYSINDRSLIVEIAQTAARLLGISESDLRNITSTDQAYAKIIPIDEGARRTFIHWASTVQGRAFSLGRFATWRPTLLLDDLIRDIRVIEGLMDSTSSGYDAEKIERDRLSQ